MKLNYAHSIVHELTCTALIGHCKLHVATNLASYNLPWIATYSSHFSMLWRQIKCVGGTCTTVMLQQQLRIRLDTCPRTVHVYS